MSKLQSFTIILFTSFISSYAMEKHRPDPLQSSLTSISKKRRAHESDGYDKELIVTPTQKRNAVYTAHTFAGKFKFFQCSLCSNSNVQSANVKKHILRKHYAQPHVKMKEIFLDGTILEHAIDGLGTEYTCNECGKTYRDIYGYKKHCKNKNHPPRAIIQEKQADNKQLLIAETLLIDPIALEAQMEAYEFTPADVEEILAKSVQEKP